jgi:tripartite-type tricarboxylate transporter receptor subunit TctC
MMRLVGTAAVALLLLGGFAAGPARAQGERLTRIIVAFPAG